MSVDILGVNLLPAWDSPSVQQALISVLTRSQLLQAGIAYWTVDESMFGTGLARALRDASGFLCVDIHAPTDIDALASLAKKGCHVYLYCEDVATYSAHGRKEPPYLLHTKMLLFWSKDRTAELWIGSHNWTNRSVLGLNVEASLVVRLRDSSSLFCEAAGYLQKIKEISTEFDLSKIDFYKQLQRTISQKTTPVIELEGSHASSLSNTTIGLFGTDSEDLTQLGTVRNDVYVLVFDSGSGDEFLYPATIVHSGLLATSHPSAGGISFTPRRHAYRLRHRFPVLQAEGPVGKDVLDQAVYFVTLALRDVDVSQVADPIPAKTAIWDRVSDQDSPLLQRLGAEARNILFRGKPPQLRHPARAEAQESAALSFGERRLLSEKPLVARRILRPKN